MSAPLSAPLLAIDRLALSFPGESGRVKVVDAAGNSAGGGIELCADARARTLDQNGNEIEQKDGGCSFARGPASAFGAAALALFLLVGLAARRRPHGWP